MSTKTDIEFRMSGPCLSFLLCDCECSKSDQVGFLIGEKKSVTTQTISDEDMETTTVNTTITMNGSYAIGLPSVFCSPLGRVDESVLKEVLDCLQKDVLGWYSFRRNCNHQASMREIFLHKELINALQPSSPEYFMFCLITATETNRSATHSKRFTFFTQRQRRFHPVSVVQTNLGEPEENIYKKTTIANDSSKCLQEVLSSINGEKNLRGAMTTIHAELNKHVKKLQNKITDLQGVIDSYSTSENSCELHCEERLMAKGIEKKTINEFKNLPNKRKKDLKRKKEDEVGEPEQSSNGSNDTFLNKPLQTEKNKRRYPKRIKNVCRKK